jgi:hypothetical protein
MGPQRDLPPRLPRALLTVLVLVLVPIGWGPIGCGRPLEFAPPDLHTVMLPDRVALDILAALDEDERGLCASLGLDVRDDTGTHGGWLDSVAAVAATDLRERGVPTYDRTRTVGVEHHALLVAASADRELRLSLELPPGRTRATWRVTDAGGTAPLHFLGRQWRPGPRLDLQITELRMATVASVLAEIDNAPAPPEADLLATLAGLRPETPLLVASTATGAELLRPIVITGRLEVELLGKLPGTPVRPDPPSPVMTEPLTHLQPLPASEAAYVALDRTGHLWYGSELGLWGPSVAGHGGGIALMEGLVVIAGDATFGLRDHLRALHISRDTGLVERDRVTLHGGPILGLAAVDLDTDGKLDLVVAHSVGHGSRLAIFVSGVTS